MWSMCAANHEKGIKKKKEGKGKLWWNDDQSIGPAMVSEIACLGTEWH